QLKADEPLLKAGYVVAYEQFQLQEANVQTPEKATAAVKSKTEGDVITVTGEHFTVTFNQKEGTLTDYVYKTKSLLEKGPQVNCWRAPTDNDYGARTQQSYTAWKDGGTTGKVTTAVKQASKSEVEITFT